VSGSPSERDQVDGDERDWSRLEELGFAIRPAEIGRAGTAGPAQELGAPSPEEELARCAR